jgi:peroxiredoxin
MIRLHTRAAQILAIALFGVLAICAPARAADPPFPLSLQDPVTGEQVRLEPGVRLLHVAFIATWCPVCVDELEALAELEARWEERGYRLVLVAVKTRHTAERLARFAGRERLPGRFLFDAEGKAEFALGARDLPMHLLLDSEGRELMRAASLEEGIDAEVARLLSGGRGASGK